MTTLNNKHFISTWNFYFYQNYLLRSELRSNFFLANIPLKNIKFDFFRLKRDCSADDTSLQGFYLYLDLNELFFPRHFRPVFNVTSLNKKVYVQLIGYLLRRSQSMYLKYFFFSLLFNIQFLLSLSGRASSVFLEARTNFFELLFKDFIRSGSFSTDFTLLFPPGVSLFNLWLEGSAKFSFSVSFYRWAYFMFAYFSLANFFAYPKLRHRNSLTLRETFINAVSR